MKNYEMIRSHSTSQQYIIYGTGDFFEEKLNV